MDMKHIIITLVIGLVAGLIAGMVPGINTGGILSTTIIGVIGAYVGSFFLKGVGINISTASVTVNTLLKSIVGAVVFVILWGIVSMLLF